MKVLIVEDNANLADVVRMGLSMEGMEAKAVYDGRDALEELNSERSDSRSAGPAKCRPS